MKNIKSIILILFLLCGILLGLFAWKHESKTFTKEDYISEKVKYGDVTQTVSANGTLNPVILVSVGTQISGKVKKIYADFNDHVKSDQILLELETDLLISSLKQSQAQVARANATLELSKANEQRALPLFKQGFISKQDWDGTVESRKSAEADLDLAQANVLQNQTNLNYATIRSPVSGVIIDRQVDVGQTVAASFQTPTLFKIAQDLGKMQIDSSFAEADIGNIKSAQHVTFTVDAFPERNFTGVVKQIRLNPTTQQNVVTYNVVVIVNNNDGVLLPGMTAYVTVKTSEHTNVLLVPNAALRYKMKNSKNGNSVEKDVHIKKTIYKLSDNGIEPIQCGLGITDNRHTEIKTDKLKPGDHVIVGDSEKDQETSSSFRLRLF